MKYAVLAVTLVAIVGGLIALRSNEPDQLPGAEYQLDHVTRGDIVRTVSASGAVQAVVTVNVGAQISGMVASLEADFNTEVKSGQVIAVIDPAPFQARLAQSAAERDVARANLARQRAALVEAEAETDGRRAALAKATADLERQKNLAGRGSATAQSLEAAEAAHAEAMAIVSAAEAHVISRFAQIDLATAQIAERQAVMRQREIELEQTQIRSPVDGVVINRNVDVGQVVAATLEAPVLFQIAQDLSQMQLTISVDEADIGRISVGQAVEFGVDAYPNRSFAGAVSQIRLAGQMRSNVVTYAVIVNFANLDLLLLPGMTADATIVVARRDNTLRAPTAAFYFTPPGQNRGVDWKVWTLNETGEPVSKTVEFGLYDDIYTEIVSGLNEGDALIVAVEPESESEGFSLSSFGL